MTFGNPASPDPKDGIPGLNGGLSGVTGGSVYGTGNEGVVGAAAPAATPTTTPASSDPGSGAKPAYTPTHADASVITAGLAGFNPAENLPQFSAKFKSLVSNAGTKKRSLIGGAF